MSTIEKRIKLYNHFVDILKHSDKDLPKGKILGRGGQGKVFESCSNKKCLVVKKIYINWKLAEFLKDQYNAEALKDGIYIELLAGHLINQLILQGISPHFALNYAWDYKERERASVCSDTYPYTMYHYNEIIQNTMTYTKWIQENHSLKEWYNAYFQITVSIYVLQTFFNMTHFDLHSENILVQKVKKGGHFEYIIDGVSYKVPNLGFRLYIIDLGQAFIPKKFKSWYVKQEYSNRRITKAFDIQFLFESTLELSTSPKEFKNDISKLIQDIDIKEHFASIIYDLWYNKYETVKENSKLIETYNLDKKLNTTDIPKDIKHLVIN